MHGPVTGDSGEGKGVDRRRDSGTVPVVGSFFIPTCNVRKE